jgi:membrane protein DedA with SNARE-associated domain
MSEIINFILQTVSSWGSLGIFILMAIESSFLPLPSELVLVPAGYLVYKGEMNGFVVLLSAVLGSVFGACVNYYLALFLGRPFLHKYGKYFFIKEATLTKTEVFFEKYGSFSTFTGRLLPVIRHLISIPAGLAKMDVGKFVLYTALGSFSWAVILVVLGYTIGRNEELIHQYLRIIAVFLIVLIALAAIAYRHYINKYSK